MTGSTPDDRVVLAVGSINADFELRVPQPPRPGRTQLGVAVLHRLPPPAAATIAVACAVGGCGSQESYPTRAALAAMAMRVRRASTRERQRAR